MPPPHKSHTCTCTQKVVLNLECNLSTGRGCIPARRDSLPVSVGVCCSRAYVCALQQPLGPKSSSSSTTPPCIFGVPPAGPATHVFAAAAALMPCCGRPCCAPTCPKVKKAAAELRPAQHSVAVPQGGLEVVALGQVYQVLLLHGHVLRRSSKVRGRSWAKLFGG